MALTDNRTQLQDCDATGDVSGDSDASPQSRTTESGLLIEGPSSIQFQVTNAQEHILFDQDSAGSTFSLNLSDQTVYIAIKDNLADTFANLGGLICLNDGADGAGGDDIGYAVAGVDVGGLPYAKKYAFYKLDVSVVVDDPGVNNVDYYIYNGTEAGLNHAAILQVGYGSIHLAKGQGTIPNAWFDGIYYIANDSYAATISGGTSAAPETMADLIVDDEAVGAGLFSNPIGAAFYIFGPTEWGDAGTGNSGFEGTDEQWFYLGDNGGGHAVGATHFPMRLVGNATGTNAFRQTRVSNINIGTRAQFDYSDSNFDEIELTASVWVDFGAITFPTQDASKFCNAGTFINCDQVDLQSCDMDGGTFNGSNNLDGAIIWDENVSDVSNQDNLTFNATGAPVVAADDFERASVGADWENGPGWYNACAISSGELEAGATNSNSTIRRTAETYAADQWSEGEMATTPLANGEFAFVFVGINTPTATAYYAYCTQSGGTKEIQLREHDGSGGFTQIGSNWTEAVAWAAGDLVRIERRGTEFKILFNGVVVITETDTQYTGGQPGIGCPSENPVSTKWESWAGGDLPYSGNAIEIAPTGAGPFTYSIDGYTFDGYAGQSGEETQRIFYINPATLSADITINLSNSSAVNSHGGGVAFSYRTVASYTGTVTINQTVTLSVTVVDENNNPVPYASVSIQNAATDAEVSAGIANNLGVYTDSTYNYTADLAVNVVARKSSPGDTRYGAVSSPNTIINTGLSAGVGLSADPNAGAVPMVGVLRHGVQSENVADAVVTATVDLPAGTSRKLVVAGMYWGSGSDLTVSAATYDGNAMTVVNSLSVGAFNEAFLYRYDIPDSDEGSKVISFTFSAAVNIKAIAFAVLDDVATGAPESNDTDSGSAVTGNPSLALNNTTADSFSVGFGIGDDLDSPTATGDATNRVRRSDVVRDAALQSVTILVADRSTSGAHNIGADFGANSKTWVYAGASFAKN